MRDKFKKRESNRTYCPHCRKDREHKCFFDDKLEMWLESCSVCDMVEMADNEIEKHNPTLKEIFIKKPDEIKKLNNKVKELENIMLELQGGESV